MPTNDSTEKKCPGSGLRAICDTRSGFYGCGTCQMVQGVMLRASHLVPDHRFAEFPPLAPGDSRFVLREGHEQEPLLIAAASQGLPTSWVVDLLTQALARMRAAHAQQAQTKPGPRIILTGIGGEG